MKILICGVSGLVGHDISLYLSAQGISWIGTHNSNTHINSFNIDFFNMDELNTFIDNNMPTVCINCIAERNVDKCENNWINVQKVNIFIPDILSKLCKERGIYYIHISSDYVFDGSNSPYLPESNVNPIQSYGISKLISELRIQNNNKDSCIIRVPVLYTDTAKRYTDTAVTLIGKKVLDQVCQNSEDDYYIRRPVFIQDICPFILECINNNLSGIHHFYNPYTKETKYSMLEKISNFLNKPISHIKKISNTHVQSVGRPYDTELKDASYDIYKYQHTSLEDGIKACFSPIYHIPLYENIANTDIFFLIDLDGTLVNTDTLHFDCYKETLLEYNIKITREQYNRFISIDDFILMNVSYEEYIDIKQKKNRLLQLTNSIELMPGASRLLDYIIKYKINHVIVTNTSKQNVDFYKTKLPILNNLTIITREDYNRAKPDPDSYQLAKNLFYKGEKYIIGIENTETGYLALQHVTTCIYILSTYDSYNYNKLKKENIYLIDNLSCIFAKEHI